ncbi:kinetochore protein SPC25 homolog [Silene latifolia]|uniref:kinetochore protein SPC25 homolog n=1 Tax=Silene latifolia TaxID=37657 RepID=UPI003D779F30
MASVHTVQANMEKLRKVCEKDISNHQQQIDSSFSYFHNSLHSIRSNFDQTPLNQVKLGKLKAELRELEDELVRALAVKTRKEAKRITIADSLSDTRIKVDELQKIVRDQAARKDEYAAILSEQSKALEESEEKSREAVMHREEIKDACTWYNRVLGFHIDGGHGVKFTFTYINRKFLSEEYSFTIRHANNVYTLIQCDPQFNDTEESVKELNKSNGLYKFVRIMRDKFQAKASGSMSQIIYQDQDYTSTSISAPSASIDSRSQSSPPLKEANGDVTQADHCKEIKSPLLSPVLAPSYRRSPRLVAKKKRES